VGSAASEGLESSVIYVAIAEAIAIAALALCHHRRQGGARHLSRAELLARPRHRSVAPCERQDVDAAGGRRADPAACAGGDGDLVLQ
jgi:hypothetical protein